MRCQRKCCDSHRRRHTSRIAHTERADSPHRFALLRPNNRLKESARRSYEAPAPPATLKLAGRNVRSTAAAARPYARPAARRLIRLSSTVSLTHAKYAPAYRAQRSLAFASPVEQALGDLSYCLRRTIIEPRTAPKTTPPSRLITRISRSRRTMTRPIPSRQMMSRLLQSAIAHRPFSPNCGPYAASPALPIA